MAPPLNPAETRQSAQDTLYPSPQATRLQQQQTSVAADPFLTSGIPPADAAAARRADANLDNVARDPFMTAQASARGQHAVGADVSNDPFLTHNARARPPALSAATSLPSTPQPLNSPLPPPDSLPPDSLATLGPSAEEVVSPAPPPEPVIPFWYPAENNWIQCKEMMAAEFMRLNEAYSGGWFTDEREVQETLGDKTQDWLNRQSGGRVGKEYATEDGKPGPNTTLAHPRGWHRLMETSMNIPYPQVDFAAGAFLPRGGRVYQGFVEDFYVVAALQALAMRPTLIANIFCNMEFSNPQLGLFMLRFYKHGQWQYVAIDDAFPLYGQFQPMTCSTEFYPDFAWAPLIEKAYAKMHGSYEALGGGGHVEEVLTDLTGGCATRYGTKDVANDRLWMYLHEMQRFCIFGCNINEAECSKRSIPIEKHWASAIWRVAKHEGIPYVCVCTAAPAMTVLHMPACQVPSPDGYGPNEGFVWLKIEDFVALFDTIYECRLLNSDLGPPAITGVECSPGWVPGMPWFEELWAFQGDVFCETAPCFIIDVPAVPNEITLEVSQTDLRYDGGGASEYMALGRQVQAPLLLRFYQCSREVSEATGGEIYLVHLSAWGHTRDASTGVKVMRPGRYMAVVSIPGKYVCKKMIFRTYSTLPVRITPVSNHRSYLAVQPGFPLDAIPFSLAGFQRVDSSRERMPQMFDEAEGRGKPMANPMYEGWSTGINSPWLRNFQRPAWWPFPFPTPCELMMAPRGIGNMSNYGWSGFGGMRGLGGMPALGMGGMGGMGGMAMPGFGGMPGMGMPGMNFGGMGGWGGGNDDGMKVVGRFGGKDARATVDANEAAGCVVA
eukprot:TRINITY_DN22615_c0_g1_i2.p1 TRINITY_DN22615_c0_g1~~TRINITY_DN22615_c0_g1_i2.p1  ORF type:complete len:836 (-),score=151.87 TRINITY_DN22615_c0_g1_i2:15-2522(-)